MDTIWGASRVRRAPSDQGVLVYVSQYQVHTTACLASRAPPVPLAITNERQHHSRLLLLLLLAKAGVHHTASLFPTTSFAFYNYMHVRPVSYTHLTLPTNREV